MGKKVWRILSLVLCIGMALAIMVQAQVITKTPTPFTLGEPNGTVDVFDGSGKQLTVANSMKLYSGYTVRTGSDSSVYISLDTAKSIELGPSSMATVRVSCKQYNVYLEAGQLFFNVTKHLAADESLTLSAPRMAASIRGTTGLICVDSSSQVVSQLFVFDGSVACQIYQSADSQLVETGTATAFPAVSATSVPATQATTTPQPSLLPGAVTVGTIDTQVDAGETVTSSSMVPIAISWDKVPKWAAVQVVNNKPSETVSATKYPNNGRDSITTAEPHSIVQFYPNSDSSVVVSNYVPGYVYKITAENFAKYQSLFTDYAYATSTPAAEVLSGLLGQNQAVAVYSTGAKEVVTLWSGSGTSAADPYQITNEQQLIHLREKIGTGETFADCYFTLTDDIGFANDYTGLRETWTNANMPSDATFAGHFDGAGHTISGFQCTAANAAGNGLFVVNSGTIDGLNIQGTIGNPSYGCGGIAYQNSGTIQNCSFSGSITISSREGSCGGIAAYNYGTILNCCSNVYYNYNGSDMSELLQGGIAAVNWMNGKGVGIIKNCYAVTTGAVNSMAGGIVAQNTNPDPDKPASGTISNCFYLYEKNLKGIGDADSDTGIQTFDTNGAIVDSSGAPIKDALPLLNQLNRYVTDYTYLYSWVAGTGSYPVLSKTASAPAAN
jgi:hypothetical protein